jgi:hypothetical protein
VTKATEYLYAAHRQIRIATYHREQLLLVVVSLTEFPEQSPIPVQACFESVLAGAVNATDKLGEAIGAGEGMKDLSMPPLLSALERAPADPIFETLRTWWEEPFWGYVRKIRKRAVHHFYDKAGPNADGAYVLGRVNHAYEQVLNGYSPTLQEVTAEILAVLQKLEEPIERLIVRYHLEAEWDEKVRAEKV